MLDIVIWLMENEGYSFTGACEKIKEELGGEL